MHNFKVGDKVVHKEYGSGVIINSGTTPSTTMSLVKLDTPTPSSGYTGSLWLPNNDIILDTPLSKAIFS